MNVIVNQDSFPALSFTFKELVQLRQLLTLSRTEKLIKLKREKRPARIDDLEMDIELLESSISKLAGFTIMNGEAGEIKVNLDVFEVSTIHDVLKRKPKKLELIKILFDKFSEYISHIALNVEKI